MHSGKTKPLNARMLTCFSVLPVSPPPLSPLHESATNSALDPLLVTSLVPIHEP